MIEDHEAFEAKGVARYLPLKPTVFMILLSVAERPRHGYRIMLDVKERSRGKVNLGTSHLYRHLKRLLDDGLLAEAEPAISESDSDPRRRYYRLTAFGRAVVAEESARLKSLVEQSHQLGFIDRPEYPT